MDRPFLKVLGPGCYNFDEPAVQLVKVPSTGLHGNDLRSFIKRAGHQFADVLKKADILPGDVPIHLIALGTTEDFGPNRNYDGFKRETCKKCHPTFVKYAKFYRHHQNKDPLKSYGIVKYSSFNERMKRVELLVMLNSTKEAAARNHGLLADTEMDMVNRNEDIPVSMSCRLPFDVCSGCGNKAKSRDFYCLGVEEGGHCKAGGLKNNIGRLTDDPNNPLLHADNPDALFFDISRVIKPADRTAYSFGVVKAASNRYLCGAEIANELGLTAPQELLATGATAEIYKLARAMSEMEASLDTNPNNQLKLAFIEAVQPQTDWTNYNAKIGEVFQALQRSRIVLPLEGFIQIITRDVEKAASTAQSVRNCLPGIYSRLINTGEIDQLVNTTSFTPSEELAPLAVRKWAEKKAADFSLNRDQVHKRITLGSIRHKGVFVKASAAIVNGPSLEIAKHYALYKLAFLQSLPRDKDFDLTLKLCVVQNYV